MPSFYRHALLSSVLLAIYSTSTIAAPQVPMASPEGGWYLGATSGVGVSETHEKTGSNNNSSSDQAYNLTNRSYMGGIHTGYDWSLGNRWLLGVEAGYQYLGKSTELQSYPIPSQLKSENTTRAVDMLLTGRYYITNQFNVFSKLGVAYEWLHRSVDCETGSCSPYTIAASHHNQTTQYHFNPEFQMGLGWAVLPRLNLSLAYQRVLGDEVEQIDAQGAYDTHINPTINSVLLGVDYHF